MYRFPIHSLRRRRPRWRHIGQLVLRYRLDDDLPYLVLPDEKTHQAQALCEFRHQQLQVCAVAHAHILQRDQDQFCLASALLFPADAHRQEDVRPRHDRRTRFGVTVLHGLHDL